MDNTLQAHGLWEASAPPAPPTQMLAGAIQADVAVVGGGYTGCSAALHLAEAGLRAVVLEAAEIGFGGSGRNVGLVNAGLWVMPETVPRILGEVHGQRLLDQLGAAPQLVFDIIERLGIDCQPQRNGTLHCAVGRKGLEEIAERERQWRKRGADVELLDAAKAARLVGGGDYAGALLDRRAGTIQPLAYVRGLASGAMAAGAEIYTSTPTIGREDLGDRWRITTPNGSVAAPWVIVATDAYSTGLWGAVKQEQVMLPYFNLATAPLGENLRQSILPQRQGVWDTRQILSSFRLDQVGRLIFGSVGSLRGTGAMIHRSWGRRELLRLFPQLRDITFEHEWYGHIGMTDDAMPRLHLHGRQIISVGGYNGRGIAPGTIFGRDLSRLVTKQLAVEDMSLPLTRHAPAPFRGVREAFYDVGSQLAHLGGSRLT